MECAVRGGRGSGGRPRAELAAGGPGSPGRRGGAAARTGRASARGEAGCAQGPRRGQARAVHAAEARGAGAAVVSAAGKGPRRLGTGGRCRAAGAREAVPQGW